MTAQRSPRRAAATIGLTAALVLAADFLTKRWALDHLQQGAIVSFLPSVIGLTLVTNTGTAFGMWQGQKLVGLLLPPLICAAIVCWIVYREVRGHPLYTVERLAFALILGGAMGNMCDRLIRGQVTDFLYFAFWTSFPVFNLADALIDVGVALLILRSLLAGRNETATIGEDSG